MESRRHLMECSVEPKTQALCHAIRAAASGPSARAYTNAPILALYGVNTKYATVAIFPHCTERLCCQTLCQSSAQIKPRTRKSAEQALTLSTYNMMQASC